MDRFSLSEGTFMKRKGRSRLCRLAGSITLSLLLLLSGAADRKNVFASGKGPVTSPFSDSEQEETVSAGVMNASTEPDSHGNSLTAGTQGSVSFPEGRTVVVTILASDSRYTWTGSAADQLREGRICRYLTIACEYLEQSAADWGKSLTMICDFENRGDLLYSMKTSEAISSEEDDTGESGEGGGGEDVQEGSEGSGGENARAGGKGSSEEVSEADASGDGGDEAVWTFIDESVPSKHLLEEYDAVNILYLVCLNTDRSCRDITATRSWYEGMPYPYEFIDLFYVDSAEVNPPAVYAHEILHTFGAPDLYMEEPDDGVSESEVQWVQENRPNDIMLTCSDPKSGGYIYDSVPNEVTDVTASYIGWKK